MPEPTCPTCNGDWEVPCEECYNRDMAEREAWERDRRSQEAADLDFRIACDQEVT